MVRRFALFFFFVLVWLTSCAQAQQPTLEATASATTLAPGQTARLTVTRYFPGGPGEDVTTRVHFAVTPPDVVRVAADGAVSPGTGSGQAIIRITDPTSDATAVVELVVLGNALAELRLEPPVNVIVLAPGQSRRFTAVGIFGDGSEQDLTTRVKWSSSYDAAATVGQTQNDIGVVTAISEGDATITLTDAVSKAQARFVVLVRGAGATLLAINVTPNPATVAVGAPTPLSATAIYANGKTADISRTTTWSSSDPTKATVDSNGVATGVAAGDVTITSTSADGSVKGSTALKVQ